MKPGQLWTLFGLCLAVALVAMAWSSVMVLRLERAGVSARAQAATEENARLALWRLDSALTSLLAQENARPYFHYRAFYPAASAYTNMFTDAPPGDSLIPSPLLRETPAPIVLHFQIAPGGEITSPQVPTGVLRTRAVGQGLATPVSLGERATQLAAIRGSLRSVSLSIPPAPPVGRGRTSAPAAPSPSGQALAPEKQKSVKEYEARQQSYAQLNRSLRLEADKGPQSKEGSNEELRKEPNRGLNDASKKVEPDEPGEVEEGAMAPFWSGDALLLTRRVRVNGARYVQGCWVDWPRLQLDLRASVRDLLPNARLEPATGPDSGEDERRLAALPVRLITGAVAAPTESVSPVRLSLMGAWAFLLLAAVSVAVLLRGVMALSERRRVFVSAVTHELRTPLTTFRLYTDMLAGGMVPSEERRREYLDRLRGEAQRLGHLVENVLFYARLDTGRAGAVREVIEIGEFLRETTGRLAERAEKAGLVLTFEDNAKRPFRARVDRSALEQILVNLVDNACKYAASSQPAIVRIDLEGDDGRARIRVRDHGPGLSPAQRRRLFQPFSKSDREAANSAPGVGLGLALSRRLARAQGGDLRLDDGGTSGATFVVSLPLEEDGK